MAVEFELKERLKEKPVVIETLGVIGSGKSTISKLLADSLGIFLFEEKFRENPYLELFYANPSEWSFRSQLMFLSNTTFDLVNRKAEMEGKSVIRDAGNVMNFLYAKTHLGMGWMTKDEFNAYNGIYRTLDENSGIKKADLIIRIKPLMPVVVERIKKRGRPGEQIMLQKYPEYLSELEKNVSTFVDSSSNAITISSDHELNEVFVKGLVEKIKRNI